MYWDWRRIIELYTTSIKRSYIVYVMDYTHTLQKLSHVAK